MGNKTKREMGQRIWNKEVPKILHLEDPSNDYRYVAVSDKVKENRQVLEDVIRIIHNNYFIAVDDFTIAATIVVLDDEDMKITGEELKEKEHGRLITYPYFVGASDD